MIKQRLLTGWHFMRWLRLGLGLAIAVQAVLSHDSILGFIAAFFLVQVATNTSCCGTSACAVPTSTKPDGKTEDIEFEEIKTK